MPRITKKLCQVCGIDITHMVGRAKGAQTCCEQHSRIFRNRRASYDQRELVLRAFDKDLQHLRLTLTTVADVHSNIGSYCLTMVDKKGIMRRWPSIARGRRCLDGSLSHEWNFRINPFEFPVVRAPGNYEVNFFAYHDPKIQLEQALVYYIPYGIFTVPEVEPLAERGDELAPPIEELPAHRGFPRSEIASDPTVARQTAMEDAWIESSAKLPEAPEE